jgi:hypothetical protein
MTLVDPYLTVILPPEIVNVVRHSSLISSLILWINGPQTLVILPLRISTVRSISQRLLAKYLASFLLSLILGGDFKPHTFFELFEVSILPELEFCCYKIKDSKGFLHALLVAFTITFGYSTLPTLCTSCNNSSSTSLLDWKILRLQLAYAHLAQLLCYTFTYTGIRTMVSLLSFSKIKLRTSSTHSLQTFTALLAGILRKRNN